MTLEALFSPVYASASPAGILHKKQNPTDKHMLLLSRPLSDIHEFLMGVISHWRSFCLDAPLPFLIVHGRKKQNPNKNKTQKPFSKLNTWKTNLYNGELVFSVLFLHLPLSPQSGALLNVEKPKALDVRPRTESILTLAQAWWFMLHMKLSCPRDSCCFLYFFLFLRYLRYKSAMNSEVKVWHKWMHNPQKNPSKPEKLVDTNPLSSQVLLRGPATKTRACLSFM